MDTAQAKVRTRLYPTVRCKLTTGRGQTRNAALARARGLQHWVEDDNGCLDDDGGVVVVEFGEPRLQPPRRPAEGAAHQARGNRTRLRSSKVHTLVVDLHDLSGARCCCAGMTCALWSALR